MRLKHSEVSAIKDEIRKLDPVSKIFLFGSRAYDNKKGGDIDILVLSGKLKFGDKIKILKNIYEKIGEQKIDIIISKNDKKAFVKYLLRTGIEL